jgi:N-acetylneuraminic acid mutarotase
MPDLAVSVAWASVACIGENIYVMGGTKAHSVGLGATLDVVQIYNVNTGVTTFGEEMPKGVGAAACGVAPDGKIYVAGGWNYSDSSYYQRVQVYDPVLDSWSLTDGDVPSPIGRSASAMSPDGTLFVFGGGWSPNVTLMYDTSIDEWTYGDDQPVSGLDGDAVVYSPTAVYVIGGSYGGATDVVRVYNPAEDTWDTAASLPDAVTFSASTIARNGYIYVLGGAGTSSTSDVSPFSSVLRYSVADDEWALAGASLSSGRDHLQVVTDAYGRTVAVGGYDGFAPVAYVEAFNMIEVTGEDIIQISSPQDGDIVSGIVAVEVELVNNWGSWYAALDLLVDGQLYESRTAGDSTTFLWDTSGLEDGSTHTLMARAFRFDGMVSEDSVTVTVSSMSPEEMIAAIELEIAALQAQLDALNASQAEKIAALNDAISALKQQLDELGVDVSDTNDQVSSIEDDTGLSSMLTMVNMILLIVVLALVALVFMMGRKKAA